MASPFANAVRRLHATVKAARGVPATYRDGADSVQLDVIVASTTHELETADGIIETYESRDFLFDRTDLVIGGNVVIPKRGAKIETVDEEGQSHRFVITMPGNARHWKYVDTTRVQIRVFTKEVPLS
ncbi:MAG: hypothetical protein KDA60_20315 [Planctomycetales bacterium]|nr:hypothetical protein [Planctomycetales bacterium]